MNNHSSMQNLFSIYVDLDLYSVVGLYLELYQLQIIHGQFHLKSNIHAYNFCKEIYFKFYYFQFLILLRG